MAKTPYKEKIRALKKAGLKPPSHKKPSAGQKAYISRLYKKVFSQGPIISRKLTKKQTDFFKQADFKMYKGRVIIPTYGAKDIKIKNVDGLYRVERNYSDEKFNQEIVLPNGARIDEEIVRAFNNLEEGETLFLATENNVFQTAIRDLDSLTKYVNNFDQRYNKNEKEMSELFSHVHVISYDEAKIRGSAYVESKKQRAKSRRRRR